MELKKVVKDILDSVVSIDASEVPFRSFQPGVGPYGEPQLLMNIASQLNKLPSDP